MLLRCFRVLSILLVSSIGLVVLMRAAPGYFADERELGAEHAGVIRSQLEAEQKQSALSCWAALTWGALHGDLGISRQYGVPVWPLVAPRLRITAHILLPAVLLASLVALCASLATATCRNSGVATGLGSAAAIACAIPVSVVALCCLLSGFGGAAGVLFVLILARDLRFFSRLLRKHAASPHLLFARAAGIGRVRLAMRHLLWPARREIAALMLTSLLVGLNAMLPVEVIFGVPGVGQLAWSAAMNRDLPVLLAVSLLLSVCIGLAGLLQEQPAGVAAA